MAKGLYVSGLLSEPRDGGTIDSSYRMIQKYDRLKNKIDSGNKRKPFMHPITHCSYLEGLRIVVLSISRHQEIVLWNGERFIALDNDGSIVEHHIFHPLNGICHPSEHTCYYGYIQTWGSDSYR